MKVDFASYEKKILTLNLAGLLRGEASGTRTERTNKETFAYHLEEFFSHLEARAPLKETTGSLSQLLR